MIESSIGDNYRPAAEHSLTSGSRAAFKYRPAKAANHISSLDLCSKDLIRDLAGNFQVMKGHSLCDRPEPLAFLISNQAHNVIAAAVTEHIRAANRADDGFHSLVLVHVTDG